MNLLKKFNNIGKNALITGACGLLGEKHSLALLETGASIVLTDIDMNLLKKTKNRLESKNFKGKVMCYLMDVSQEVSITNVLNKLNKDNVRIDILINNAAINPKQASLKDNVRTTRLENFSLETWNLELSVGLTGAFLCSKIFGSEMAKDKKGGVILNIASDLSVIAPDQRIYKKKGLEHNLQAA